MPKQIVEQLGERPTDSRFHELLAQLAENYDKEVVHLRTENDKLRNALAGYEGAQIQEVIVKDEGGTSLRAAAKEGANVKDQEGASSCKAPSAVEPQVPGDLPIKICSGDLTKEAKDTTEFDQGFELKGQWTQIPVASGSWGQELDTAMVTSQAHQLVENCDQKQDREQPGQGTIAVLKANQGQSLGQCLCRISSYMLINPASQYRMVWDLIGMVLIFYDMLSIPLVLCFQPEDHWFSTFMGWFTLIFWTCDVFGSLFTGFYQKGELVMKQSKIIKQYLKGWFWIDMIVVVPDWTMKAMGGMTNLAGLGRILRAARIMRVLRMLRLLKLRKLFALVYDVIDSEYMWIVFSLIKLLFTLLIMNHMVACLWYLVGRLGMDTYPKNWLQHSGHSPVYEKDLGWKYLTSLHWSITQFTPASMDISATNSAERIFSIAILFWAMVCLSSIIGTVSASMTALRNMSGDEMQKFWMLRRYFKQKNISRDLSERVIKFLEYECTAKKDVVPIIKVALLKDVSESLKLELANEMHSPLLICHPFFKYVSTEITAMMFRLCQTGLRSSSFATDDMPFMAGDEATSMYFFKKGLFEYKLVDGHVLDTPLGPKTWASEAALWTAWRHRGSLTALVPGEVTEICPGLFIDIFRMHPRPWHLGRKYGEKFVEYMNCINLTALTDVIFDNDIFEKLVIDFDDPYAPANIGGRSSTVTGKSEAKTEDKTEAKQAWA